MFTNIILNILIYLCLIEGEFLSSILLASAIHQHESAICIYMCLSRLNSPSTPHPIPISRFVTELQFELPSHIANSHWLSVLHMVMYMFPCYSFHLSHGLLPCLLSTSLFSKSLSPLLPLLHVEYLSFVLPNPCSILLISSLLQNAQLY